MAEQRSESRMNQIQQSADESHEGETAEAAEVRSDREAEAVRSDGKAAAAPPAGKAENGAARSGKIVCVDGHSILNRAFYGIPELTNSQGVHTNAVYGFMNILLKVLSEEEPQYLMVAFDRHEPTFRHKMFSDYKGTRKPMPEELREQVPIIKRLLTACQVPICEIPGYEADDILGTMSRRAEAEGMEVTLLSGDRDLLQLATEHTCIRIPKTKAGGTVTENYHAANVLEKYHVTPSQFVDVKALMGDTSDNIPGVPGIGEKTATNLIAEWGSLDNIHEHLDEVKPPRAQKNLKAFWDQARMSRDLAQICVTAPVELDFDDARLGDLKTREAYEVLAELELKSLMKHFDVEQIKEPEESRPQSEVTEVTDADGLARMERELIGSDPVGMTELFREEAASGAGSEKKHGSRAKKARLVFAGLALCRAGRPEIWQIPAETFSEEELTATLNRIAAEVPDLAVQNLKEERRHFSGLAESGHWFDAGVASYLLNPLKSSYDIGDIARDALGETVPSADPDDAARVLAEAAGPLRRRLQETGMEKLFDTIETPLIGCLDRMEKAGIRVEREALKKYGENLISGIDEREQRIYEAAGHPFNINSPKQLGEVLFDEMKLPYAKKTKTGYSTNADILEKLRPWAPIAGDVLEYRTLTKLKSTYADGLAGYIGPDERIHGHFNQTITATGRISSTDPNLQNIPVRMELGREIRRVFVPAEGCLFVDADYSQIELRILAHMSGDEKLIEAYREEKDIHRITASQVFHVPFDEVTPEQRRNAKAVNFGIVYGISAFGLSEDLSISRKEASEYIEQYFQTYPGVKVFLDNLVRQGYEQGYVTTMYGRRRPIPELKSKNFMQRQFGERVAMNSPIQGTAADIMKIAMIRVDRALQKEGLRARIVLQVHDELLLETPRDEKEKVEELLVREMQGAADLRVPLIAAVSTGETWFETK